MAKNGTPMNADGVRALLRSECDKAKTMKAWAAENDLSVAYVCDVLQNRREPGASILEALGLEKIVTYQKAQSRKRILTPLRAAD
jgi:hypothetical protein